MLFAVAARIVSGGSGLILESNFAQTRLDIRLSELARSARTVVIVCRIPDAVRRARFDARAEAGRHRVHVDSAITAAWMDDDTDFLIDVGAPTLIVNTRNGYDPTFEQILTFARGA